MHSLDRQLLEVERKHRISIEQADWETRQPPTEIEIDRDNEYAVIPIQTIKSKWGFMPSQAHLTESHEMKSLLQDLIQLITNDTLPPASRWEEIVFDDDDCILIFWE